MKKVTVRMAEAEHAELVAAAYENRRSLQGEIEFRLFPNGVREELPGQAELEVDDVQDAVPTERLRKVPEGCTFDTPVGTKCKSCGKVH
jgi:hypothetical protein